MRLFIATPSYSKDLSVDYVRSVVECAVLLTGIGVPMEHHVLTGCPFIGRARNDLVDRFLKSDCDNLLFLDSDVGFDVSVLPRVLNHKPEIVGGFVPKRDYSREEVFHHKGVNGSMTGIMQDGLFQSIEMPTAFMRIKRSAFDKIAKPYFRAESSEDAFGEDIYFCRKWISAGEHFWVDSDITFSHTGDYIWRGNFYDHCIKSGLLTKTEAA